MSTGSDGPSGRIRPELTAIGRGGKLSRPARVALQDGLIKRARPVHDFGCGRGDDVRLLRAQGYEVTGWDPNQDLPAEANFLPTPRWPVSTALCIYVLNTIPEITNRIDALKEVASIPEEVLVVAIRSRLIPKPNWRRYNDGYKVPRNGGNETFQRSYTKLEIQDFVHTVLGNQIHMVDSEVGYVFKNLRAEQEYFEHHPLRRLGRRK